MSYGKRSMDVAKAMNDTDKSSGSVGAGLWSIGNTKKLHAQVALLTDEELIEAATNGTGPIQLAAIAQIKKNTELRAAANPQPGTQPPGTSTTVKADVLAEAKDPAGIASQQPAGQIIPPGGITEAVPPQQVAAVDPQQQQQQQPQMMSTGGVVNLKDGFAAKTYEESELSKAKALWEGPEYERRIDLQAVKDAKKKVSGFDVEGNNAASIAARQLAVGEVTLDDIEQQFTQPKMVEAIVGAAEEYTARQQYSEDQKAQPDDTGERYPLVDAAKDYVTNSPFFGWNKLGAFDQPVPTGSDKKRPTQPGIDVAKGWNQVGGVVDRLAEAHIPTGSEIAEYAGDLGSKIDPRNILTEAGRKELPGVLKHAVDPAIYKGLVAGSLDTAGNWIDSATNLANYKGVVGKGARAVGERTGIEALQNFRFDPTERQMADARYLSMFGDKTGVALPPGKKAELKALRDAEGDGKSVLGELTGKSASEWWDQLTGSSDKTKKPPVTTDKADKTKKADKGDKTKKGGSSSAELQGLLDQLPFKADKTGKMTKETALALMAAGAKMMATKRPDFLGAAGEGLEGFTTQANLQNKLATDRMLAEGKLATAGRSGVKDAMVMQAQLQTALLAAKEKLAKVTDTGRPEYELALKNKIDQMEAMEQQLWRITGIGQALPSSKTDAVVTQTS